MMGSYLIRTKTVVFKQQLHIRILLRNGGQRTLPRPGVSDGGAEVAGATVYPLEEKGM